MRHASSPFLDTLLAVGHTVDELLPAFPGMTEAQVRQVVIDSGACLNRPVLPYGILGMLPQSTPTFNVSPEGFRLNGGPLTWPPDPRFTNIFFFGGSTALGFGVPDQDSIPAQLELALNKGTDQFRVYNFAYGSFTSRQEFLKLLDLLDHGFKPDVAIFLDGLNETHYAFGNDILTKSLNSLYLDEKRRRRLPFLKAIYDYAISLKAIKQIGGVANYTPSRNHKECEAFITDERIRTALKESNQPVIKSSLTEFHHVAATAALDHYITSRNLIIQLANEKKFQLLFVWQPISYLSTRPEQRLLEKLLYHYRYHIICWAVYRWLEAHEFAPLVQSLQSDSQFLNLVGLGKEITGPLYVDSCHYSPLFCRRIGEAIGEKIKEHK